MLHNIIFALTSTQFPIPDESMLFIRLSQEKLTVIHIIYALNKKTVLKDLDNAFYHDMCTKITRAKRLCFFPENV